MPGAERGHRWNPMKLFAWDINTNPPAHLIFLHLGWPTYRWKG